MNPISITITGEPVPKGRPRFSGGRAVTPDATRKAEAEIKHQVRSQLATMVLDHALPLTGAVVVVIELNVPIPPSWSKAKRAEAMLGGILPTSKPDLDNLAKMVMDALNGIVWNDDAQVVNLVVSKRYSIQPRTVVTVWPMAKDGAR